MRVCCPVQKIACTLFPGPDPSLLPQKSGGLVTACMLRIGKARPVSFPPTRNAESDRLIKIAAPARKWVGYAKAHSPEKDWHVLRPCIVDPPSLSLFLSKVHLNPRDNTEAGSILLAFCSKRGENRDLLVDRVEAEHIYR